MFKKSIIFVAGIALGLLLAVALYVTYVVLFPSESPSKARLDLALKMLDQEQKRLGIQCVDGDKFILSYIDAVAPVVEKLANGERLSASDPIIAQGSKASDVMFTCARFKNMTEADNSHILSGLALGKDAVIREVSLIQLALSRTLATWCSVDCIQDTQKEILANSLLVRQSLTLANENQSLPKASESK